MFRSPTQPEGSPKSTMYFSKLKPEAVGERAGDKQIRLRAEAVARARAAEIAALPPYNETFGKFNRLSSSEREAILLKYGISSSGTNQERYTRLMAVNRKKWFYCIENRMSLNAGTLYISSYNNGDNDTSTKFTTTLAVPVIKAKRLRVLTATLANLMMPFSDNDKLFKYNVSLNHICI